MLPGAKIMALTFNGSTQYITIPDSADFAPGTGDFTLMFWMKTTTGDTTSCVMSHYSGTGGAQTLNGYYFELNVASANKIRFSCWAGTGSGLYHRDRTSTTSVNTGAWFHVCGSIDHAGDVVYLYINGVLEGTSSGVASIAGRSINPTESFEIGRNSNGDIDYSAVTLADVKYWNGRRLTADQITTEAKSMQPQFYLSDCKLWLPMEHDVVPSTVRDQMGNGHVGTLTNSPTRADSPAF